MKFSMSEAWRDATVMMSANREVLLIVAGLFFLLPSLVPVLAMPEMLSVQDAIIADPENASAMINDLFATWGWTLLIVGIGLVLWQIVGYLALLALLRDTSRPTVGEALKAGLRGLLPALGFYVILAIALIVLFVVVGVIASASAVLGVILMLACFVLLIYVMVKLSLVLAVIAIESTANPIAAMARSWQLTKGNSLRLFLFFLLIVIVYLVVSIVVGGVLGALVFALGTTTALVVNGAISGILSAAFTVVLVAVVAATHRQLSGPSAAAVSETFE